MKISIVIPNYNKEKYIYECLKSCLSQTYENTEIIVIDNESSDKSLDIINELKNQYKNKFIFDQAKNIYPRCWDECIEKAFDYISGEYYTVIASDDYINENYIKNSVKFIKNTNCNFFQSPLKWVDQNNNFLRDSKHEYCNINELKSKLLSGCYINTPTVFRKTSIETNNNLKTNPLKYSGAADYDLYCQLVDNNFYIENCNEWLGYFYRINEDQETWKMHNDEIKYDKLIQKKWRDKWKK